MQLWVDVQYLSNYTVQYVLQQLSERDGRLYVLFTSCSFLKSLRDNEVCDVIIWLHNNWNSLEKF